MFIFSLPVVGLLVEVCVCVCVCVHIKFVGYLAG